MKIVIAPDSFKESLAADKVCDAIEKGVKSVFKHAECIKLPMADGGEGTAETLQKTLNGQWRAVTVNDPLMRPIQTRYVMLPDNTAIMEMASCAGLHLLASSERNPTITTTYGVGEMIIDAIEVGATRIILGIGGSATNDAGMGMLMALGYRLLDTAGKNLPQGGAALASLATIDASQRYAKLDEITITVACDVTNPLCGDNGASAVYGPQKGATSAVVELLDAALANFATLTTAQGWQDNRFAAGAGAAGGLGFALMTFLKATLTPGFALISELMQLATAVAQADLVITGEGKMDYQTRMGKVAAGVLAIAKQHAVPVVAICGVIDDPNSQWQEDGFAIACPTIQQLLPLEQTLAQAAVNIEKTVFNLAMAMKLGKTIASD